MTRFAGHSDITNFLQRNQYADQIGAAGMSAYADQAIGGFEQDAHVAMGGIQASNIAERGRLRRKFGGQIASQNRGAFLRDAAIDGVGNILGGAIRGGTFDKPSISPGTPTSTSGFSVSLPRSGGKSLYANEVS